ncbi:NDP-hexose 2,3-dehydratase family protein [Streptomyces griseoviridis]|uniref:NDP-hexose 2,3-dehydratase n=1 Tax=Streptomyces griseoviridis TaxID=45398 RepID=A0A3Q9KLC9_STRGD|nr:NDP-hexose 2,3-dehydratase family protein [Streptomyces griseoviridis]AZS83009.1 NDP-hexose 2,3-dehydratase [Streptomyces griseoviridis]QCN90139.1 NDP-hexose 2,3-dehydratase [Streptomyces griseoviridis]
MTRHVTSAVLDSPRPRDNAELPGRLARSAATTEGAHLSLADFPGWLAGRDRAHRFEVRRIPFAELDAWSFDPVTGDLGHRTGRFFTVRGLRARAAGAAVGAWQQPVIDQPEVGILGILAKEFDGVLHFLMQAKMEPGNPNLLQLSPTVQATRSNYTRVHQGAPVRFLDHFQRPERVVADTLQSEHGSWFYRKANRNLIVETSGEVEPHDDFCWLTLGQIHALLRRDNLVNMDSRTVLSCLPLPDLAPGALHSDTELLSWITGERARHEVAAELIPLGEVAGWVREEARIRHAHERFFDVVAVSVRAGSREVTSWTQPLFEPRGLGVTAFLTRRIGGVRHYLAQARVEGGFLDTVELGPTVQCVPGNVAHLPPEHRPRFLDTVLRAGPERIRYAAVHAEEGGRFLNAESRYLVVEATAEEAPTAAPEGFRWVTAGQLTSLVRHAHYINVQARTLLACLYAMDTGEEPSC